MGMQGWGGSVDVEGVGVGMAGCVILSVSISLA
jgi:hypothetical protein